MLLWTRAGVATVCLPLLLRLLATNAHPCFSFLPSTHAAAFWTTSAARLVRDDTPCRCWWAACFFFFGDTRRCAGGPGAALSVRRAADPLSQPSHACSKALHPSLPCGVLGSLLSSAPGSRFRRSGWLGGRATAGPLSSLVVSHSQTSPSVLSPSLALFHHRHGRCRRRHLAHAEGHEELTGRRPLPGRPPGEARVANGRDEASVPRLPLVFCFFPSSSHPPTPLFPPLSSSLTVRPSGSPAHRRLLCGLGWPVLHV